MKQETKSLFIFSVRDIVEIAIFIALAVVFDTFVKIPVSATGGSVNIATLPLFFIALKKGWFKGFLASGIIFALITCLIDGYGFVCFPLDYFLGFGSIFVLGFFSKLVKLEDGKVKLKSYLFLSPGVTIAFMLRFIFSTISGVVIYGLDIPGSMLYQITYLLPSYLAVLILINLLLKSILKLFERHSI